MNNEQSKGNESDADSISVSEGMGSLPETECFGARVCSSLGTQEKVCVINSSTDTGDKDRR